VALKINQLRVQGYELPAISLSMTFDGRVARLQPRPSCLQVRASFQIWSSKQLDLQQINSSSNSLLNNCNYNHPNFSLQSYDSFIVDLIYLPLYTFLNMAATPEGKL
jgi:hypothetical protein